MICFQVFEHPAACAFALFDEGDPALVFKNVEFVTGLNMKTVT